MNNTPEYNYYTGPLGDESIAQSLSKSLSQYLRYYDDVKVGITADPKRRFTEHRNRSGYERMVVVYRTSSIRNANKLEKWFIENRNYDIENEWEGQSNMTDEGPYFVYFIMRGKKE